MRWSRGWVLRSLAWLACACASTSDVKPNPNGAGAVGSGGAGGTDPGATVATIIVSASTNSSEIVVTVHADGSATRTLGPPMSSTDFDPAPQTFVPDSPEVTRFLGDLQKIGDVSSIPISSDCPKSISFGTTTTIFADGKTSGDLECMDKPTSSALALLDDARVLAGI